MGKNKQISCKICFKTMRSNNLKRHMRVHIIYTSPEVQTENSEEICKDIVNDIVDKMFMLILKKTIYRVWKNERNNAV